MGAGQQRTMVEADPMLVRCLTLHQTVLEHSDHGLTKEQIYRRVDGYAGRYREAEFLDPQARDRELAALERRFSSDKRYLRDAGIPLEESEDVTGEHRYRIRTDIYGLPDLELTETERLALHQAQSIFSATSIGGLQHALWAAGGAADPGDAPAGEAPVQQSSIGSEAELDQLLQISLQGLHRPLAFSYTGRGRLAPETRHVVPLALGARGHWYLIAHDLERSAQRVFRLDRIQDTVRPLKDQELTAAQRESLGEVTQLSTAQTEEVLTRTATLHERREALEGVVHAHTGPGPDPGRLRPATGQDSRESIGLRTDRVINMTAYLLATGGAAPSRLMREYRITAEQLHRDLLSIEQSGPNVGMSRYVVVDPELPLEREAFTREYLPADETITLTVPEGVSAQKLPVPVSLTKPGALGLLIALKMMSELLPAASTHLREAAESLQQKVLSIVPETIAAAAEAMTLQQPEQDTEVSAAITAALAQDHCLQIDYTDAHGVSTTRTVEPVHLIYDGPHTYLRAWCRHAVGERLFRLDRVSAAAQLPETPRSSRAHAMEASPPEGPTVERTTDSLDGVVLRFAPFAAGQASRYAPQMQRRDASDGAVFIRTHFRSRAAAVRTCVAAGGDIELIRPAALRDEVRETAQRELHRWTRESDSSSKLVR